MNSCVRACVRLLPRERSRQWRHANFATVSIDAGGKAYQKAVKRELRAIKAARKGLRESELTDAQKARRDAKAARAKERRRAQAKARKKAKPLSEAQIAARKEKFQRKKKRREERRAAGSA